MFVYNHNAAFILPHTHTHTSHSEAPSGPPQSLSVIAISSTLVILTWTSPLLIDINGIIRNYFIRIRERETSQMWIFKQQILTSHQCTLITTECEVAAHTIATGPYTNPVSVQTMEAGNNIVQLLVAHYRQLLFATHINCTISSCSSKQFPHEYCSSQWCHSTLHDKSD